jgi:large conductance mechanosensitive channel
VIKEFREFILRGNLVDLAVAVVIGTAVAALIASFVSSLLTPLIAAIVGEPSFGGLSFTINGSEFFYGDFLNALITFLSVAAAVFFLVVKPMNLLLERVRCGEAPAEETEPQILVLEEIRDLLAKQAGQGAR